jgi:hypothetical protein
MTITINGTEVSLPPGLDPAHESLRWALERAVRRARRPRRLWVDGPVPGRTRCVYGIYGGRGRLFGTYVPLAEAAAEPDGILVR